MINWFPDGIPLLAPITLETLKISLTSSHSRWTSSKADSSASAMSRQQLDKGGNKKTKTERKRKPKLISFWLWKTTVYRRLWKYLSVSPFTGPLDAPSQWTLLGIAPPFDSLVSKPKDRWKIVANLRSQVVIVKDQWHPQLPTKSLQSTDRLKLYIMYQNMDFKTIVC